MELPPGIGIVTLGFATSGSSSSESQNSYDGTDIGPSHVNDCIRERSDAPCEGEFNSIPSIENDSTIA